MGSLFQRLAVSVDDPALAVVPFSDVRYLVNYEPEAYGHWIFNKQGVGNYTSEKGDKALTPVGTVNNTEATYLSMSGSVGNALITDVADTALPIDTYCFVIRNTNIAAARTFFGNASAEASKGWQFYYKSSGNLFSRHHTATEYDTTLTHTINTWRFVAISRNQPASRRTYFTGGQAAVQQTAGVYTPTVGAVALRLGNQYYSASTNAANIDYAEFQIYNKELTAADLATVYARSKARMAALGITVV